MRPEADFGPGYAGNTIITTMIASPREVVTTISSPLSTRPAVRLDTLRPCRVSEPTATTHGKISRAGMSHDKYAAQALPRLIARVGSVCRNAGLPRKVTPREGTNLQSQSQAEWRAPPWSTTARLKIIMNIGASIAASIGLSQDVL